LRRKKARICGLFLCSRVKGIVAFIYVVIFFKMGNDYRKDVLPYLFFWLRQRAAVRHCGFAECWAGRVPRSMLRAQRQPGKKQWKKALAILARGAATREAWLELA